MLVLEAKLYGSKQQFKVIDEMIRTAGFVRNKCLRYWMDKGIGQYDLSAYCKALASEFDWAKKLNSQARQASAERAWSAIKRFYDNCKRKVPGKKVRNAPPLSSSNAIRAGSAGFPRFKKARSVEYKVTGWKLSHDRQTIVFTDKFEAGDFRLRGAFDLNFYDIEQIKRVRVVRKADGYYVQFCVDHNREELVEPSAKGIGLDLGLLNFYTDSEGNKVDNPRHLRKSERSLKRLQKRVSQKQKGSSNRQKALNKLGRKHLKVSRQRKDWAMKLARCVVMSNDFVAHEDLKVSNLVKNSRLAKSISDAGWRQFLEYLSYYGKVFGKVVVSVAPNYTSQQCSSCGELVKKALSQRTHVCRCGCILDWDENAALNILAKGLRSATHRLHAGKGSGIGCSSTAGHAGINAYGQNDCRPSRNYFRLESGSAFRTSIY